MTGFEALLHKNVSFEGRLFRNIYGLRESENLFDDLAQDDEQSALAINLEHESKRRSRAPLISRPFEYGKVVVGDSAATNGCQMTRFSDGLHFGVWYGALEMKTTVYETAYHWFKSLAADGALARPQRIERRVFTAACCALLVDLRTLETNFPALVDQESYHFTHRVGDYLYDQHANGLLVKSARCEGTNAAILRAEVLSDPQDHCYLTYRWEPETSAVRVERRRGRTWLKIKQAMPSSRWLMSLRQSDPPGQ